MTVRLSYVEHGCTEKDCDGEIVAILGAAKLVRKAVLEIPGRKMLKAFASKQEALDWAARHGYKVEE